MRVLILTQGQHTVVDDDVYEWASKFKWYAYRSRRGKSFYALRSIRLPNGKRVKQWLHREILKAGRGVEVDHIDGDGLHNLRENLRLCSPAENKRNCSLRQDNNSGYRGVSFHAAAGKWWARIQISGQPMHLGLFEHLMDAARAYDRAAIKLHGAFARINFPKELHEKV